MSNRRKTPSERKEGKTGRCPKCRCRDTNQKAAPPVHVCMRCGHHWPVNPA